MKLTFDPAYLTRPETEQPELLPGECETFDEAQRVFKKITSEYRVALLIDHSQSECILEEDDLHVSKTGGMPLFPKDMTWPLCERCGEELTLKYQLRKAECPALPTPEDKDMLLLFTCPEDKKCASNLGSYGYNVQIFGGGSWYVAKIKFSRVPQPARTAIHVCYSLPGYTWQMNGGSAKNDISAANHGDPVPVNFVDGHAAAPPHENELRTGPYSQVGMIYNRNVLLWPKTAAGGSTRY